MAASRSNKGQIEFSGWCRQARQEQDSRWRNFPTIKGPAALAAPADVDADLVALAVADPVDPVVLADAVVVLAALVDVDAVVATSVISKPATCVKT